jgi:3-oxoadipate enol-lactonase
MGDTAIDSYPRDATTELPGTAYRVSGEGPPVVLVHGLGLNQNMWQWQRDALNAHFTVIEYDLLGHGDSAKPPGPYPMKLMTDQIIRLIDHLGIERCALVGFSLGGLIVQSFALAHPGRTSALVILNAAHGRTQEQRDALMNRVQQVREHGPASTVEAALERWFTPGFARRSPQVLEQVRQWVLANDAGVYPEVYHLLAQADIGLERAISNIKCPTLVVTGEEDHGNSPAMSRRMAELIPGARAEILEGLRHMALAEDPEKVNTLLLSFLLEVMDVDVEENS